MVVCKSFSVFVVLIRVEMKSLLVSSLISSGMVFELVCLCSCFSFCVVWVFIGFLMFCSVCLIVVVVLGLLSWFSVLMMDFCSSMEFLFGVGFWVVCVSSGMVIGLSVIMLF